MERPTDDAREVRERHAAAWAAALDAGPLDAERHAQMEEWLSRDDRNRGALIRAQVGLRMLTRPLATDTAAPRLDRRVLLGGVGASCVAAFAALALWPSPRLDTAVGEIRQIPLPDGSNVVLDTATALRPRFSADRRDMRLERGRALFRVAHDPDRPFIVEADSIRVRAIGTMFSVDVSETIEVLVAEGVVEVSGQGDPAILRAGQRGRFDRRTAGRVIATVSADDLVRDLDWREGRLELEGQSLGEAAATMNRYTSRPIVITDAELAAAPLHGGFRTDDPEGFARAAALSLGARSHTEPNRIVISR